MSASQITDQISWSACKLEICVDGVGTVWKDISGESTSIEQDGGDRAIEEKKTMKGDTPLLTAGKRDGMTFNIKSVYSETADNATPLVQAAYEAVPPTLVKIRWSPKGGTTGQKQYTTGFGFIETYVYPVGDADSAEAVMTDWSIHVPSVATATVA